MVEVNPNTTRTAAALMPGNPETEAEVLRRREAEGRAGATPREGEDTGAMAPQHMVAMMGNVATIMPWAAENQSVMRSGEDDYTSCHGNPVVMERLQAEHSAPPPEPEVEASRRARESQGT